MADPTTFDFQDGRGPEGDPVRIVPRLFTLNGELVAELDPLNPGKPTVTDAIRDGAPWNFVEAPR